jgi:DNA polymerase
VNREEKETLYTFLETADRMLSGGTLPRAAMPSFADDPVIPADALSSDVSRGETIDGVLSHARTQGTGAPTESIAEIASRIACCERCVLCQTRTNVVPGIGPERPLVMVIGEGPGADEDAKGEPFVGKAGQLLDKMLLAIGLSRKENCFIANVVKCRPPENRDPAPEEAAACAPFLEAQIAALKPRAILAVGRVAAQNLLKTTDGIGKLRGRVFDYGGIPLMPTYHPSALLRDENLKRPAWEDLKRFKTELLEDGTP